MKFDRLTFAEVFRRQLKVMDTTAVTLCMENKLPIIVFKLREKGNLQKVVLGEKIGTFIGGE